MALQEYRKKRSFTKTPEPSGEERRSHPSTRPIFVIQKHAATRLHYDFRLEHEGVLKSWAVPHGPSLDPSVKALAVQVEDHPIDYASFEGIIPKGQYGGGTVMVWDRGTWECDDENATDELERGRISFRLHGEKLQGMWTLVRMRGRHSENWLLIKKKDEFAASTAKMDIVMERPLSVLTQRDLSQIADDETPQTKTTKLSRKRTTKATQTNNSVSLKRLARAPVTTMPEQLKPQLATLSKRVPAGKDWLHEIKLDGYRILARIDDGQVALMTRSGLDWTDRFPSIAKCLNKLPLGSAWLDGEIIAPDEAGISSFQQLQNALANADDSRLVFYVFDLPWAEGHDLSQLPLMERKEILKHLLNDNQRSTSNSARKINSVVRYHDHIEGAGEKMLASACDLKLEGIVSKRRNSVYEFRRTDSWLKTKCQHEQEFVIAGFTRPAGQRSGLGALLLGYYSEQKLIYCGRVGTGFSEASLRDLTHRLRAIQSDACPFTKRPTAAQLRGVTWVHPQLVAQVSFAARTHDGILRHAVFHGLREDKAATEISLEQEKTVQSAKRATATSRIKKKSITRKAARSKSKVGPAKAASSPSSPSSKKSSSDSIEITHPGRIVYQDPQITKAEFVQFLSAISEWILPGVVGRPLSILRCPQGVAGNCFYQKQFEDRLLSGLSVVKIQEKRGATAYPVIEDLNGLMALAQLNAIEFHPWPALAKNVEQPDRLIFDLDPGEAASWRDVIQGALEIRQLLHQVDIESFVRTSGGKGLHVVAPLKHGSVTWDELKAFAKILAQTMARQYPKLYVATITKSARKGKVFVDYLRNQRGATAVASYSPRARANAGIAMPLRWEELSSNLTNSDFTVSTSLAFLKKRRTDPWAEFYDLKQTLPKP